MDFWQAVASIAGGILALFVAVVGAAKLAMSWVERNTASTMKTQQAVVEAMIAQQERITGVLDNHLGEIGRILAAHTELLREIREDVRRKG